MRTAFWISENSPQIKITENEIFISGRSSLFRQKYFNPLKLILFRLITISFGWNTKGAFYLKRILRKALITKPNLFSYNIKTIFQRIFYNFQTDTIQKNNLPEPSSYKRSILFSNNKIETIDILFPDSAEKIFYGGGFSLRYVPQSNYFQDCDFLQGKGASVFKGPFEKKPLFIRQTCYLKDFSIKVELCAESPDTLNSKKTAPLQ